ncbi:MAG: hypothetical protein J6T72_00455, partial [Alphaproteobacteria bacterium]|nr:hypothetical protein [Alphaproteobacteria bacterium]
SQVSEKDSMGDLFKNLRMLLTDVDIYLAERFGITMSQHEKDMILKMPVQEFVAFLERKLKERDMQRIADTVRSVGAVRMSVYIDATDRICDLVNTDNDTEVSAFLAALAEEFGIAISEDEHDNVLRMCLSELADFILRSKQ